MTCLLRRDRKINRFSHQVCCRSASDSNRFMDILHFGSSNKLYTESTCRVNIYQFTGQNEEFQVK